MKIALFGSQPYDRRFFDEALPRQPNAARIELVYHASLLSLETAPLAQGSEVICVFVNDVLDADVLQMLHDRGARAILLRCAGYNNVDLEAAARLGFFIARVPAYSPEAVAEHALALVMTLNRQTHRAYARVREGNFALDGLLGTTLHGKTVGIVGTGKIGLATARIFKGMGCTVLGHDPFPSEQFEAIGRMVDLPTLLAISDVVSLHCPLTDDTRHMIRRDTLVLMKRDAMLVNTSRGALIDTGDVIAALKARRLGYLAIDVYEQESALFFQDRSSDIIDDDVFQRLMTFPNVLVTGHQGFFTIEALREIAAITFDNLACYMAGAECGNSLPLT